MVIVCVILLAKKPDRSTLAWSVGTVFAPFALPVTISFLDKKQRSV